jgi:hypothetical protein
MLCGSMMGGARVIVPGPQASPSTLRWHRATSMAACITYELPGSLLKLIYDEGMSAVSLPRVVLPTVSKLTAAAGFPYRLGGVGMSCEEEQRRGPDGKLLCLVCDQRRPKRIVFVCRIHGLKDPASSGTLACISMGYVVRITRMLHCATKGDAAACGSPHIEEAHPSQCLQVLRRLWHSPHSCEGHGDAGWHPVRLWVWGSLLLPVCHYWRKRQQRSYAVPLPPRMLCAAVEVRHGGPLGHRTS